MADFLAVPLPGALTGARGERARAHKEAGAKVEKDRRAAVIAKELGARGVPENEIASIGMGADKPLVSPDDTAAKKAKNRRYEIQVRL